MYGFSADLMSIKTVKETDTAHIHTRNVVRKFQWWHSLLHVDVEDVVVLLAFVKLFSTRSDGIHDIADLLPIGTRTIPLSRGPVRSCIRHGEASRTWCASTLSPRLIILTSPDFFPMRSLASRTRPTGSSHPTHLAASTLQALADRTFSRPRPAVPGALARRRGHRML